VIESKDYFENLLNGKRQKNTERTEDYAKLFLEKIGVPLVHKVDRNPAYKAREKGLFTPDYVIWQDHIGDNDPNDFYVDVQEITGGPFDATISHISELNHYNPVRDAIEKIRELPAVYANRQTILINEYNPEILKAIFQPILKKSEKYGNGKRASSRFGLISVQSPGNEMASMVHFKKIVYTILTNLVEFLQGRAPEKAVKSVYETKIRILEDRQNGLIPFLLPFNSDCWCFWAIIRPILPQQCLFLVNSTGLERAKQQKEDQATQWLEKIAVGKGFEL